MVERKRKDKSRPRSSRRRFVIGWVALWAANIILMRIIPSSLWQSHSFPLWVTLGAFLPTLQFFWIRSVLKVSLRWWVPLAMLGAYVGSYAFGLYADYSDYSFSFASVSGSVLFPVMQMPPGYALHLIVTFFLTSSTPLIFQWLALRKRFRYHGLWLLAAVVVTPLSFTLTGNSGIFKSALRLLDNITGHALAANYELVHSLIHITALLDDAIPIALLGLVLHLVITQSKKADAAQGTVS